MKYTVAQSNQVPTFLQLDQVRIILGGLEVNGDTLDYIEEKIRRELGRVLKEMLNGKEIIFSAESEELDLPF